MRIYVKEDPTKVDFKYFVVVGLELKNDGELNFIAKDLARLFHMTYIEYIEHVAKNFNGVVLDYGGPILCDEEIFFKDCNDANRAKEWIESMFILREIGK